MKTSWCGSWPPRGTLRAMGVAFGLLSLTSFETLAGPPNITFQVSKHTNQPGQTVTAEVSVKGFTNITSAQFTLQWDPAVIRFQDLGDLGLPSLSLGNFGTTLTNSGKLTFSWDDPTVAGVSVANDAVIFSVRYVVIGSAGSVSALALVDSPTPREVAVNLATANFVSINGEVRVPATAAPDVTFSLGKYTNQPGQTVTSQVRVLGFTNVTSSQFTLQWDPAVIRFQSIGNYGLPDLGTGNFGTTLTNNGKLTFSWDDPTVAGVSRANGTVIFTVSFLVVGASGSVSALSFVDTPTPREVAVNMTTANFVAVNGEVRVHTGAVPEVTFELGKYTNQPGQAVGAVVSLRGFTNVTSAQFTVQWDPAVIRFQSIGNYGLPDLGSGNFGTTLTNSGKLTFSWDDPTVAGVSVADGTTAFVVNFLVLGPAGAVSSLALVDTPTPREVAVNLVSATFVGIDGEVRVGAGTPPTITQQPLTQTVNVGADVTFSVGASGSPPLSYFWRRNGNALSGASSSSYTLANVSLSDSGSRFSCIVSNAAGVATSDDAVLTVVAANTVTYSNSAAVVLCDNASAQPYPSVITINGQAGTVRKVTATLDGLTHSFPHDVGVLLVGPAGQAVVLVANAGGGQGIANTTITFDDDAQSELKEFDPMGSGCFRPSACGENDVFVAPVPAGPYSSALLAFKGRNPNGTWALYAHDDATGDNGVITRGWSLTFTIDVPLQIAEQPREKKVIAGTNATFHVGVLGNPPFSYVWRLYGTNLVATSRITGVNTANLLINEVQDGDAGPYDVVVANASESATSAPAMLTVLPAATPYFVPGSLYCLPNGQFTGRLAGAPGSNYQIRVSADLKTWKASGVLLMTNRTSEFVDPTVGLQRRFYRAKLLP